MYVESKGGALGAAQLIVVGSLLKMNPLGGFLNERKNQHKTSAPDHRYRGLRE